MLLIASGLKHVSREVDGPGSLVVFESYRNSDLVTPSSSIGAGLLSSLVAVARLV